MTTQCVQIPAAPYRNFNLCPHCVSTGQQALLCRVCEGSPMISRSDGETFHLLLTDHPMPYGDQGHAGASNKLSVCFWYAHVRQPNCTYSTTVILASSPTNHLSLFRKIELVADLLTADLAREGKLGEVYELFEHPDTLQVAS